MKTKIILILTLTLAACTQIKQAPKQYSIEDFYKNIRFTGGSFSPDDTTLLVSSDESGIFNAYEINIADGSTKKITSSDTESIFAIDFVPGTNQIIYSADKGGNEINHIYLLKEDGSVVDLTPGEKEKAQFAGWSDDKKYMFYLSNKRDPRFFDLYKMEIGEWKRSEERRVGKECSSRWPPIH